MKKVRDYNATIQKLKQEGAIGATDAYALGVFNRIFQLSDIFWALGGFISVGVSSADYLVASDGNILKIFSVNQRTGEYLGNHIFLSKEQINRLVCTDKKLKVKAKSAKLKLAINFKNVFRKFDQTNNKAALLDLLQKRFVGQVGKNAIK